MRKHKAGAVWCRPSFDYLEERSLLSGYTSMPAGPALGFGPSGAVMSRGPSPAPHELSSSPTLGGFAADKGTWAAHSALASGPAEWQPDSDSSYQPAYGPYSSSGGPSFSFPSSGQYPFGFTFPTSTFAAFYFDSGFTSGGGASSRETAASNGPSGDGLFASTSGSQVDGITVTSTIVTSAGAHDLNAEAGGIAGVAQIGPAVTPPVQTSLLPEIAGGQNTRLAPQADGSTSSTGLLMPVADMNGAFLPSPRSVRTARSGALDHSARFLGNEPGAWPRPSSADVIAGAIPFDRATLERAIDRFIEQIDDLGASDLVGRGPARIILLSMALASGVLALDVLRRRWLQSVIGGEWRARDRQERQDRPGFPQLPGSWSSRLT